MVKAPMPVLSSRASRLRGFPPVVRTGVGNPPTRLAPPSGRNLLMPELVDTPPLVGGLLTQHSALGTQHFSCKHFVKLLVIFATECNVAFVYQYQLAACCRTFHYQS
jgi:hypothetical protein